MHNPERDAVVTAQKQQQLMKAGFRLFSEKSIEAVSMNEVARESGVGIATAYRYYENKMDFALAIAVWKWSEYWTRIREANKAGAERTGAQEYTVFLESFMNMYRNEPELLRYNYFLNAYTRSSGATLKPGNAYERQINQLAERFREIWEKGKKDGTLRTETPWHQVFSTILHIMFSAITRYSIGLLYRHPDGSDPEAELLLLKDLLLNQYISHKRKGEGNRR